MTKKRPGPKPNQDMPDIVDLLLATGCRIGEVLAIRWTDIDLSGAPPTVSVSGTIKTETGKGTYRKPKPKSDASKRTIALPPFAVDVLMRRRIEQRPNHYNAVFATRNGTWHQVGNIERRWRTIRADTGFDWVTPHTFRKDVYKRQALNHAAAASATRRAIRAAWSSMAAQAPARRRRGNPYAFSTAGRRRPN